MPKTIPPFKIRHLHQSEKGQISIMIGLMMMTFILFFAFVINVGMLVNAKINLQNAADLAAYAGAATQARQLTHISYLNYEMRRQWKKFLFRIYVIGNMSQDSFPHGGGSGPMNYIPNNQDGRDYQVPTTCVIFNSTDNYCHLTALPAIAIPNSNAASNFLDSVTATLTAQLQAIENIRQNNCKTIGITNKMLNIYWLFNADPNLSQLDDTSNSNLSIEQQNALKIVRGLAHGLGILPREAILRMRIQTLSDYVNSPALKDQTIDAIQKLSKGPDPMANERTIQAFYSAYYTLGNHTFPASTISLDELLPGTPSQADLLKLENVSQPFDLWAVDFMLNGHGDCAAVLVPIPVKPGPIVGVYKDSQMLTYYAIRLKAKAKILFSPFGDIDMKAYAAAQPFGSRIGPGPNQKLSFAAQELPNSAFLIPGNSPTGLIPSVSVQAGENVAKGIAWDTQDMQSALYSYLTHTNNPGSSSTVDFNAIESAYVPAMAPNPWETNQYNIPNDMLGVNDTPGDSFVRNFGNDNYMAFWAPVLPPGSPASVNDRIQMYLTPLPDTLQGNNTTDPSSNNSAAITAIKESLKIDLEKYVSSTLARGAGEEGESLNIVRIKNPLLKTDLNQKLFVTDNRKLKTSWNSVNDINLRKEGRVGYSVKFVSFDSLTQHKNRLSDQGDTLTNDLPPESESDQDIPSIKH